MVIFIAGDRVVHKIHGPGVVVENRIFKNDRYGINVKFDNGYVRGNVGFYRADVKYLTPESPISLENK